MRPFDPQPANQELYSLEDLDGYRTFVPHAPWDEELDSKFRASKAQGLYLNYALGFTDSDLGFLRAFPLLRALKVLVRDRPLNLAPIHDLHNLTYLSVDVYGKSPIDCAAFPLLRGCFLMWRPGAETVFDCAGLTDLFVSGCRERDLERIGRISRLASLRVGNARILETTAGLEHLTSLESLGLLGLSRLGSVASIGRLDRLTDLVLRKCRRVEEVEAAAACTSLRRLILEDCGDLDTLLPFSRCEQLEEILMIGTTSVRDGRVRFLTQLPALRRAFFVNRPHYDMSNEELGALRPL